MRNHNRNDRNFFVNNNNDRKLQQYNKSMTVTLLRCVTELLQCYFVIVQPRRSTNRPSTIIGSGDRHPPTSPPPSSFRLHEHRASTSGTPVDRCTRASDIFAAASRDSPALPERRRLPRPSGVVQWLTWRQSSRRRRRGAGGCWREDVPSRPARPPVATVPCRPASRRSLGDVIRVVQGGQPQILDMPPRALAKTHEMNVVPSGARMTYNCSNMAGAKEKLPSLYHVFARHNARKLSSVANTTTRSRAFCPLSCLKNGFGSSPTKLSWRRIAGSGGTIACLKRRIARLAVCILSRSFAASDAFNNAPASSRAGWTSPTTALSFSVAGWGRRPGCGCAARRTEGWRTATHTRIIWEHCITKNNNSQLTFSYLLAVTYAHNIGVWTSLIMITVILIDSDCRL